MGKEPLVKKETQRAGSRAVWEHESAEWEKLPQPRMSQHWQGRHLWTRLLNQVLSTSQTNVFKCMKQKESPVLNYYTQCDMM